MRRKKLAILASLILMASTSTFAKVSISKNSQTREKDVDAVKITFSGAVTERSISELINSVSEINASYRNAKHIYLYINSGGGDMDSGYMAYEAIKSSPIPITTVNLSMTASSATMIHCAGSERLAMPFSYFLLHPAAIGVPMEFAKPNELEQMKQLNDTSNSIFLNVYKKCTTYSDEELSKILFSEDNRKIMKPDTAKEKGIINGITQEIKYTPVSYYVLTTEDDN